ncbi:MAG: thioredoxin family protein [Planctomycetes bacterium]|nr:thioredoxin family protein [Planctomycetota bacterium]
MRISPAFAALALAAAAALAPAAPAAEDPPPPPAPAGEAAPPAAPAPAEIAWETDFAAARAKAAKEGRGLLVYLTPDPEWFDCHFCRKLQAEGFTDPEVQGYVASNFVAVRIEDPEEDRFASTSLGLTDMGYPNIVLLDAAGAYEGRVVGFAGRDPWFAELRGAVDRAARIRELRAKVGADAKVNADLAPLLAQVPDGEKAALEAFAAVPADARTPALVAAELKLRGRLAWSRTSRVINDEFNSLLEGVDRKDREVMGKAIKEAYRKMAPVVSGKVDEFLREFPDAEEAADALLTKANSLLQSDALREGIDAFKGFLAKHPEHPAADRVRQMIEAAERKLAEGKPAEGEKPAGEGKPADGEKPAGEGPK